MNDTVQYKEEEKLENSMKINMRLWITNGFCVTNTIVCSKSISGVHKIENWIEIEVGRKAIIKVLVVYHYHLPEHTMPIEPLHLLFDVYIVWKLQNLFVLYETGK